MEDIIEIAALTLCKIFDKPYARPKVELVENVLSCLVARDAWNIGDDVALFVRLGQIILRDSEQLVPDEVEAMQRTAETVARRFYDGGEERC